MIVVTGAAGFIGSCMITKLSQEGCKDIIAVDDFSNEEKNKNLKDKNIGFCIDREVFFVWLKENYSQVECIYHIGARTDTAEFDWDILEGLNLKYSQEMWKACTDYHIPLVYASSAATYGMGEHGYSDNHEIVAQLQPLNPYGKSKNEFDKWVLQQTSCPPFWAGFKFFNVYGPNEYHKGRMASVIFHSFNQINKEGFVKLFRSHRPDYQDGMQLRDFVYVKDVVNVLFFVMQTRKQNGIYNLGTGKARAFLDLAKATFSAMGKPENIQFIDTPEDIRDKYQYFTQAEMQKLLSAGYTQPFYTLEEGVSDYVKNYLMTGKYL